MALAKNEEELDALQNFKPLVNDIEVDEGTLMRFLRARNLDLLKAEEMLRTSVEWRKDNVYQQALKGWKPEPQFMMRFEVYTSGNDLQGRPVIYIIADNWCPARPLFDHFKPHDFITFAYRTLTLLNDRLLETEDQQIVAIIDNENLGFSKMFYEIQNWTGIQTLIDIWQIYESNFPEMLNKAFLINTARAFMWGFNLVKPFMTKHTLSKISIYGSDEAKWKPLIQDYIPEDAIPKKYGGTAKLTYLYDIVYDGAMQKMLEN